LALKRFRRPPALTERRDKALAEVSDTVAFFGLRRQSAAATALSRGRAAPESSDDSRAGESGVALRFPPHSITSRPGLAVGGALAPLKKLKLTHC